MSQALVLQLNKSGQPISWINREGAATLYAKNRVLWELGEKNLTILGGYNRFGERSRFDMAPIIASDGDVSYHHFTPSLSNRLLFRRDAHLCMYCGHEFKHSDLSRDHILPTSLGGRDRWENVVTACKRCNHSKANRTPEDANMTLLAVPFAPNPFEYLYLSNRNILADQMEYLSARFSSKREWV